MLIEKLWLIVQDQPGHLSLTEWSFNVGFVPAGVIAAYDNYDQAEAHMKLLLTHLQKISSSALTPS